MELRGNVTQEQYEQMVKTKGKEPLNPIGTCFDSSAFQMVLDKNCDFLSNLKLCHGIIIANSPGQEGNEVVHAWIECQYKGEDAVVDVIWGEIIRKTEYYTVAKPKNIIVYSKEETLLMWAKYDYPGPWDEKLKEKQKNVENRIYG